MGVVSPGAITAIRRYAESNMDALVTILRGGAGVLDRATGKVSGMSNAKQIYGDPVPGGGIGTKGAKARIHTVSGQGSISLGPGQIDTRSTTVSIPWSDVLPQRDDLIIIRSGGQDSTLVGSGLRVVEIEGGGLFGDARRMSCTLWGKSGSWDGVGA